MSHSKRFCMTLAAAIIAIIGADLGGTYLFPGFPSFVTPTQAVVGRPLTPVSVAGVARRTVRRCAVGVYNC